MSPDAFETTFEKFSTSAREALKFSQLRSAAADKPETQPVDLLLAILQSRGGLASEVVAEQSPEELLAKLPSLPEGAIKRSPLSMQTKRVIQDAAVIALKFGHHYVGTEHLLWAVLRTNDLEIKNLLAYFRVDPEKIKSRLLLAMRGTSKFPDFAKVFALPPNLEKPDQHNHSQTPALDFFCEDLTLSAKDKALDPLIGREAELEQLVAILSRRKKNNPILVGDPGTGKTAIVEGLAQRIIAGKVPHALLDRRVVELDLASVLSGTMYRGEFESRIKQILEELQDNPDIIVFIDEIHNLVGAGSAQGALDAANMLKPALARGDIRCIGATTYDEYRNHIEKDAALERRFQPIDVAEPSPEEAVRILEGVAATYSDHHNVRFTPEALQAAVDWSVRYIPEKFLPDKAIDLLDDAGSVRSIHRTPTTREKKVREIHKKIKEVVQKKEEAVRREQYTEAMALKMEEQKLEHEHYNLESRKAAGPKTAISPTDIAKIISRRTHIPAEHILGAGSGDFAHLEERLAEKIVGQNEAVTRIAEALRRTASGIAAPGRPIGSFLFLGPTGVGKTATAKAIAEVVFGTEKSLIRFDMSEFAEPHTVAKLLGSPAGYIGYDAGGKLTNAVRRRPYSVVLFDEIEKAHRDVHTLLLQILDEGFITDSAGRKVDFRHAVIVLTSNSGGEYFHGKKNIGFGLASPGSAFAESKAGVLEDLKKQFRPEMLARLDYALVFEPLTQTNAETIAQKEITALQERIAKNGRTLDISTDVIAYLGSLAVSSEHGARAMLQAIRDHIEAPLARILMDEAGRKEVVGRMMDGKIMLE